MKVKKHSLRDLDAPLKNLFSRTKGVYKLLKSIELFLQEKHAKAKVRCLLNFFSKNLSMKKLSQGFGSHFSLEQWVKTKFCKQLNILLQTKRRRKKKKGERMRKREREVSWLLECWASYKQISSSETKHSVLKISFPFQNAGYARTQII